MLISVVMILSKRPIYFSVFLINLCFARIFIKESKSEKSDLIEGVVNILQLCYANRTTAVGIAGNFTGIISKELSSRGSASITLIDETARLTNFIDKPPQNKLQIFVITASSASTLNKTLIEIKASIWWNHMANFLLMDSNHGCTKVFEILWMAWEMNALNAKFLCSHETKGLLIYTYNPYMSKAPNPWKIEKTYSGKNNHPWTLFVRIYENSKSVCNELDYDKTVNLGGYEIRVAVIEESFSDDHPNPDRICVSFFEDITCKIIFHALNATPNVKVHDSYNALGTLDETGKPDGILGELFYGFRDIGITERYLPSLGNLTYAYPHMMNELRSLTQYSGYKSQLSKICGVIDGKSRLSLCLVCFISVLFFKYFLRQSATRAQLSTLRLICNSSLPTIPGELSPRIYLGSLFLFAVTMQGIFQGKLASLLAIQKHLRNVNTMNDLAELGHTIYGWSSCRRYFTDPAFDGRYVEIKTLLCTEYVLQDPTAACVCDKAIMVYDAVKYNLHMSSEALAPIWSAVPIRPDWPLEHRISMVLMTAVEAQGLIHLLDNAMFDIYRLLKMQENRYEDETAKVLSLEQLGFAFAILGIGLGFATLSFVYEVKAVRNFSLIGD